MNFLKQIIYLVMALAESFDAPYRKDRSNHGGGLLVYINSEFIHTRKGTWKYSATSPYGSKLRLTIYHIY